MTRNWSTPEKGAGGYKIGATVKTGTALDHQALTQGEATLFPLPSNKSLRVSGCLFVMLRLNPGCPGDNWIPLSGQTAGRQKVKSNFLSSPPFTLPRSQAVARRCFGSSHHKIGKGKYTRTPGLMWWRGQSWESPRTSCLYTFDVPCHCHLPFRGPSNREMLEGNRAVHGELSISSSYLAAVLKRSTSVCPTMGCPAKC